VTVSGMVVRFEENSDCEDEKSSCGEVAHGGERHESIDPE
jgi:hypothetical protein